MSEYMAQVLKMLQDAPEDVIIDNEDEVYLPSQDLRVKISIERAEQSDNGCMAVIYYWLFHPSFEEPLFETAAALGQTVEQAVENAVKSFYAGIYTAAIDYLSGGSDHTYETEFFGEKKEWDVVVSDLVMMGKPDKKENYWEILKEGLKPHLGNKQLYYIKVFASKQAQGDMICECRVNDSVSAELSKLMEEVVSAWDVESFHSQKQFFFISQKSPSMPYPYSKKQIEDFTSQAVMVFADCDSDEKYENLMEDMHKFTDDYALAAELRNFLPEMCAEHHFEEASYSEYITLYTGEDSQISVCKDCFTPYNWIRNKLINGFIDGEYPDKAYGLMISLSATYNAIQQMQEKNSDISHAVISTGMYVPDGYKVR